MRPLGRARQREKADSEKGKMLFFADKSLYFAVFTALLGLFGETKNQCTVFG